MTTTTNLLCVIFSLLLMKKAFAFTCAPRFSSTRLRTHLPSDFFGGDDFGDDLNEKQSKQQVRSQVSQAEGSGDSLLLSNEELEALAPEWAEHVPKFSRITLVGRVGNDPEPRYFDDGKVVLNLSLAVRRKYHPLERRALEIQEDATDWFTLELWGRDAEYASKYVTKGARVGVSGSLAVDSWVDRLSGEKRSKCTVIVKDLDILESKAEAELRRGLQSNSGQKGNDLQKSSFSVADDDDEFLGPYSAGTGSFFK